MTAAKDTLGQLHSAADFSVVDAELYRPARTSQFNRSYYGRP